MPSKLTTVEKREIIYTGERLKVISSEVAELNAERNAFNQVAESEEDKRRRIYVAERLVRLSKERASLLAQREMKST